jgi:hypothetical protein
MTGADARPTLWRGRLRQRPGLRLRASLRGTTIVDGSVHTGIPEGANPGLQPSKVRNGLRSFGPGIRRASGLYLPAIARAVKIKRPGLDCASVVNSFRTVRNAPATLEWVRVSVFALAADFAFAKEDILLRSLSGRPHRTGANDASSDVFSRQPTQPAVKA